MLWFLVNLASWMKLSVIWPNTIHIRGLTVPFTMAISVPTVIIKMSQPSANLNYTCTSAQGKSACWVLELLSGLCERFQKYDSSLWSWKSLFANTNWIITKEYLTSWSHQCDGANKELLCCFFFLLFNFFAVTTGAITVWKTSQLIWQRNLVTSVGLIHLTLYVLISIFLLLLCQYMTNNIWIIEEKDLPQILLCQYFILHVHFCVLSEEQPDGISELRIFTKIFSVPKFKKKNLIDVRTKRYFRGSFLRTQTIKQETLKAAQNKRS